MDTTTNLGGEVASLDNCGPEAHAAQNPHHSNQQGHFCPDNDNIWICKDCDEFKQCRCFARERQESPTND